MLAEEFADLRRSSGATVLASASGRELAFESGARKNGLFTAALLEGLDGARADRDRDGELRVSELRQFVADRVTASSGGRQHPTARRENVILDFPVY